MQPEMSKGKGYFFVQIMIKFKKVLNMKIIPLAIAVLFLFNSAAYGIDISDKSCLRVPVGGESTYNRIAETIKAWEDHGSGAIGNFSIQNASYDQKRNVLSVRLIDIERPQRGAEIVNINAQRAPPGDVNEILQLLMVMSSNPMVGRIIFWYTGEFARSGKALVLEDNDRSLLGLGTRNIVAVSRYLKDNPIAWFHEIAHAYFDAHPREISRVESQLVEGRARWINIKDQSIRTHYILRAFQRQIFGEQDRYLTQLINNISEAREAAVLDTIGAAFDAQKVFSDRARVARRILLYNGEAEVLRGFSGELVPLMRPARERRDQQRIIFGRNVPASFQKYIADFNYVAALELLLGRKISSNETIEVKIDAVEHSGNWALHQFVISFSGYPDIKMRIKRFSVPENAQALQSWFVGHIQQVLLSDKPYASRLLQIIPGSPYVLEEELQGVSLAVRLIQTSSVRLIGSFSNAIVAMLAVPVLTNYRYFYGGSGSDNLVGDRLVDFSSSWRKPETDRLTQNRNLLDSICNLCYYPGLAVNDPHFLLPRLSVSRIISEFSEAESRELLGRLHEALSIAIAEMDSGENLYFVSRDILAAWQHEIEAKLAGMGVAVRTVSYPASPKGSILNVFSVLTQRENINGAFTEEEIAGLVGRAPSTVRYDIRALLTLGLLEPVLKEPKLDTYRVPELLEPMELGANTYKIPKRVKSRVDAIKPYLAMFRGDLLRPTRDELEPTKQELDRMREIENIEEIITTIIKGDVPYYWLNLKSYLEALRGPKSSI